MSHAEEKTLVSEYRHKQNLSPAIKRRTIIELGSTMTAAEHRAPVAAVVLLPRIWELRQALNFGCLPVVVR